MLFQHRLKLWWQISEVDQGINALSVDIILKVLLLSSVISMPSTSYPLGITVHNVQKFSRTNMPWKTICQEFINLFNVRIKNDWLWCIALFYLQRKLRAWWQILEVDQGISALSVDIILRFPPMSRVISMLNTLYPLGIIVHNVQRFLRTNMPWKIIWLEFINLMYDVMLE